MARTLLHGPLKFKVSFVAKLLRDLYYEIFSTYIANKSIKPFFFTLNCVPKRANDFKLIRFAFDLLQKFEAVPHEWKSLPNPSDKQHRYNKYPTNLVFTVFTVSYGSSFFSSAIYGPSANRSQGKKLGP